MSLTAVQLAAFAAVARERSVQGAADVLGVSQPSVSSAVAAVARTVGAPLTERDGRGIRLTPAGAAFAPFAEQALGAIEQGRRAAREAAAPDAARVRLAAVHTAGEYLMPGLIQAYRAVRPSTEVLLEVGNRRDVIRALESRTADLGIAGRPMGTALAGHPVASNALVVVARSPAADLRTATWLLREEGSGTRAVAEGYLQAHHIEPRERLTLGSNGAIKRGLALGLGVSLVSVHAVAGELADGTLHRIAAPATPLDRPFHVLYVPSPPPRPAVAELIAYLDRLGGAIPGVSPPAA